VRFHSRSRRYQFQPFSMSAGVLTFTSELAMFCDRQAIGLNSFYFVRVPDYKISASTTSKRITTE
jgi:hypothetical protein